MLFRRASGFRGLINTSLASLQYNSWLICGCRSLWSGDELKYINGGLDGARREVQGRTLLQRFWGFGWGITTFTSLPPPQNPLQFSSNLHKHCFQLRGPRTDFCQSAYSTRRQNYKLTACYSVLLQTLSLLSSLLWNPLPLRKREKFIPCSQKQATDKFNAADTLAPLNSY
jgi:hypothetical protein